MFAPAMSQLCTEMNPRRTIGSTSANRLTVKDKPKKSLKNQLKKQLKPILKRSNLGGRNVKLPKQLRLLSLNPKEKVGEKNWPKNKPKRKKKRNKKKLTQLLRQLPHQLITKLQMQQNQQLMVKKQRVKKKKKMLM